MGNGVTDALRSVDSWTRGRPSCPSVGAACICETMRRALLGIVALFCARRVGGEGATITLYSPGHNQTYLERSVPLLFGVTLDDDGPPAPGDATRSSTSTDPDLAAVDLPPAPHGAAELVVCVELDGEVRSVSQSSGGRDRARAQSLRARRKERLRTSALTHGSVVACGALGGISSPDDASRSSAAARRRTARRCRSSRRARSLSTSCFPAADASRLRCAASSRPTAAAAARAT